MKANTLKPKNLDRILTELSQNELKLYRFLKKETWLFDGIMKWRSSDLSSCTQIPENQIDRLLRSLQGHGLINLHDLDIGYWIVVLENIPLPFETTHTYLCEGIPQEVKDDIFYVINEGA